MLDKDLVWSVTCEKLPVAESKHAKKLEAYTD